MALCGNLPCGEVGAPTAAGRAPAGDPGKGPTGTSPGDSNDEGGAEGAGAMWVASGGEIVAPTVSGSLSTGCIST